MRTETIHYCETCGNDFKDSAECKAHEANCEKYKKGDRVEIYYEGKWWHGTVSLVSSHRKEKRFMVVRTDEQFDKDVDDVMHTGYDMGIWERTGDKKYLRRLPQEAILK